MVMYETLSRKLSACKLNINKVFAIQMSLTHQSQSSFTQRLF